MVDALSMVCIPSAKNDLMHKKKIMFRQSSRLRWAPGPVIGDYSNEVKQCKNLNNFGTQCADSKRIGNSTSDMLLITHNVIYIPPNFKHMQALLHTWSAPGYSFRSTFIFGFYK